MLGIPLYDPSVRTRYPGRGAELTKDDRSSEKILLVIGVTVALPLGALAALATGIIHPGGHDKDPAPQEIPADGLLTPETTITIAPPVQSGL